MRINEIKFKGFVFAIAHIRGGGEKGRLWYKNGKFLKKKNTFLDFVSSAEAVKFFSFFFFFFHFHSIH